MHKVIVSRTLQDVELLWCVNSEEEENFIHGIQARRDQAARTQSLADEAFATASLSKRQFAEGCGLSEDAFTNFYAKEAAACVDEICNYALQTAKENGAEEEDSCEFSTALLLLYQDCATDAIPCDAQRFASIIGNLAGAVRQVLSLAGIYVN